MSGRAIPSLSPAVYAEFLKTLDKAAFWPEPVSIYLPRRVSRVPPESQHTAKVRLLSSGLLRALKKTEAAEPPRAELRGRKPRS